MKRLSAIFARIPLIVIFIVTTVTGFYLGRLIHYVNFLINHERHIPELLLELPDEVIDIESIVSPTFGKTVPLFNTSSGELIAPTYPDRIENTYRRMEDREPCSQKNLEIIQQTVGEVIDCKQGYALGEWVTEPRKAYAITAAGELWVLVEELPDRLTSFFSGVVGGVLGVIVALVVLLMRIKKHEEEKRQLHDYAEAARARYESDGRTDLG